MMAWGGKGQWANFGGKLKRKKAGCTITKTMQQFGESIKESIVPSKGSLPSNGLTLLGS